MSDLGESERPPVRGHALGSRLYFSVALIALGVLLFLGNLGLVPIQAVWLFWPVPLIAVGVGRLLCKTNASTRVWGVFMVLFGCLFLLGNLGWLPVHMNNGSWIFSLILMAIGFSALTGVLESARARQRRPANPLRNLAQTPGQTLTPWLNDFTLFGAVKRKVESNEFAGGDLTCIFGAIEIDLRRALISVNNSAVLNATAVFGSTKIRVPENWRVHVNGASVLGSFEDKTVPPNTGQDAPMLVITGLAILGSVEIED